MHSSGLPLTFTINPGDTQFMIDTPFSEKQKDHIALKKLFERMKNRITLKVIKKVLLFQKWLQVDAGVDLGVLFS